MTTANRPPPLDAFREDRTYLGADHLRNERRTWLVAGIYALTLVVLLTGGVLTGSMALTAAGLHMAAHCGRPVGGGGGLRHGPTPCEQSSLQFRDR